MERIDQKCLEKGIQGYKGKFIDFLQCQSESFMPCIDIAAKSKLMTIIVDTTDTAKQVLDINKEIKGGVINIYPLETMNQFEQPPKQIP